MVKSLRKHGSVVASRAATEILDRAPEEGPVGEHRERSRAAGLVRLGGRARIEVGGERRPSRATAASTRRSPPCDRRRGAARRRSRGAAARRAQSGATGRASAAGAAPSPRLASWRGCRRERSLRVTSGRWPALRRWDASSLGSLRGHDGHVSRRVRLGCCRRGAPDRGRQLEQRLVGVGARGRTPLVSRCRATPATATTATPTTSRSCVTSGSAPTASPSSGLGSSPKTANSRVAALDHYRRDARGMSRGGLAPVVTFHHFTTPRWMADRGGWSEPDRGRQVHALLRERRSRISATSSPSACTINEPNVLSLSAT